MNRAEVKLKKEVRKVLINQGYTVNNGIAYFTKTERHEKRNLHQLSRAERINDHIKFIQSFWPEASKYILNSSDIDITKIKPKLIEIQAGTREEKLFRWWNLVWWSLPYERAYGRQMRFIVWDDYHKSPIGLIGLQSPILSWNVRDKHLGITAEKRDYWVNQSLSAQRLGSLPPYNNFLGGKLVALLMTSNIIREAFKKKYEGTKTLLLDRTLPADLLFITTTGAYGKSSVYNRLAFNGEKICEFIGDSSGCGSFHIPTTLYEGFLNYLREKGYKAERAFGHGPSVKMKNIDQALRLLGFKNGCNHGMKRAVYLFPLVSNLLPIIQNEEVPVWYNREPDDLTDYWKNRWAYKRVDNEEKTSFLKKDYLKELSRDLEHCQKLVNKGFGV